MANRAFSSLSALVLILSATAAHAQSVNVTAANSSNDAIYSVSFNGKGGGSIMILNTDSGALHHLTSLAFITNPSTFQLDLLAADNQGGVIVRYPGDFHTGDPTVGSVVFNGTTGTGPEYPDGLSFDGQGDLFVVNAKPGNASNPQLWVLPSDGSGGFVPPMQIDAASYGPSETLDDTLVVGTTIPLAAGAQLNPGDLLVLTTSPSQVLLYPGANGNGPLGPTTGTVLINLPTGALPGGLAFWPPDNSLLVTTSRGTIYQYQPPYTGNPTTFASGLGNGQFKIKTGIQSGLPYAYVANNNGGDILEFAGPNNQIATVTSGVQHPQGLAVTNINYTPNSACQDQQTNGCDILGQDVITHNVPTNLSLIGNIIENVCLVPVDPRLVPPNSSCTTSLPVSQVCAGFSSTIEIPASLCGSSGPTGKGFALVKTLTQAYQHPFPFNGSLIFNDSNLQNILPPSPTDPVCNPAPGVVPLDTLTWAPLPNEGIVTEGNNLIDITSGCDGGGSRSSGYSMFGVGLSVNTAATGGMVGFATGKYVTVLNTLTGEEQESAIAAEINPGTQPPDGTLSYQLRQCISTSQNAFAKSATYYDGAARELLTADQDIAAAVASPSPPFTPMPDYPNPSGMLRMRLQNMYYTINTRIDGNPAMSTTPSPPPAPPLPVIKGTPATTAKAGTVYSFTPTGADFAGNTATLTYSIVNKPSWATLNYQTGQLSGTAVKGTYPNIVITVTDGCASASLPAFQIRVN